MLEAALAYLARGWSIVPGHVVGPDGECSCKQGDECDRPGKHPRVRWKDYQSRPPTTTEARVWWGVKWKTATICVITGQVSGLIVVDIDPRHGGDEAWRDWTATHHVPDTPTVTTGGGGQHLYFKHPMDREIPNGAGLLTGVDLRGDGGYVLAPPSPHPSGSTYEWDSAAHLDDIEMEPFPDNIYRLSLAPRGKQPAPRRDKATEAVLDEGGVGEGARNSTMTSIVGLFAKSATTQEQLFGFADGVNQSSFKPPLEERELRRIVASIWKREQNKEEPQAPPELNAQEAEDMTVEQRREKATEIWKEIGVPAVTDWVAMRSPDGVHFVLVLPEGEVNLGTHLFNYQAIRIALNSEASIFLPKRVKGGWEAKINALRLLARDEIVELLAAADRANDWIVAYIRQHPAHDETDGKLSDQLKMGPVLSQGKIMLRPARLARFIEAEYGEKMTVARLKTMLKQGGWTQHEELSSVWEKKE